MTLALIATLSAASFGNTTPLTEEQELLLSINREQNAENFEAFRSTLDVFQLAILENPELSPRKKHEAIKSSLTLEQEAIMEATKVIAQAMREDFRNTLTEEQKGNVREIIKASFDMEQTAIMETDHVLREIMKEKRNHRIHS